MEAIANKIELFEKFHNYRNVPINPKDGAYFSEDRQYRYLLWRTWDNTKPLIMFIGLNPSTANESKNDPTIRRVLQFAKDWDYGGVLMMNLFAIVSSSPKVLKTCADPLGDNNSYLRTLGMLVEQKVFCWGNFDVFGKDKEVVKMFPTGKCLLKNKNGSPRHPLYVSAETELMPFRNLLS